MKKLIAILLSILLVLLIFASCDTGDEEKSSEPVSEVPSLEISSEIESEISTEVVSKEPYSFVPEVLFDDSWEKTELTDEWKKQVIDDVWMYRLFFFSNEITHPHNFTMSTAINYYMHHTYDDPSMMDGEIEISTKDVAAKVGEKFANVSEDWVFLYQHSEKDLEWEYDADKKVYRNQAANFGTGGASILEPHIVSSEENKDGVLKIAIAWLARESIPEEERKDISEYRFDYYYVQEDGIWKIAKVIETTEA